MARKPKQPPATYDIPFDTLFCNVLRSRSLQIPEITLFGTSPPADMITVDADHLCRWGNKGITPVHVGSGYLYLSESGWDAHKHRLLSKMTQAEVDDLDKTFQAHFQSLRDAAVEQRESLRKQIADLEAYWPHLQEKE